MNVVLAWIIGGVVLVWCAVVVAVFVIEPVFLWARERVRRCVVIVPGSPSLPEHRCGKRRGFGADGLLCEHHDRYGEYDRRARFTSTIF